jgi:hypothetical protein
MLYSWLPLVNALGLCCYCREETYIYEDSMYLCLHHYIMYLHGELEWEALISLVNQSVSAAIPPPIPTTYPSGNQPAPPCADTEPETHQGNEAYDASSDH